jgi:hypothetical protein
MGAFDFLSGSTGSSAAGGLAAAGTLAAATGPIGLAIGAVGLGLSLFGGISGFGDAQKSSQIQGEIVAQEREANMQRQQAMVLSARRQSTEIMRQNQRQQSLAQSRATNQGAQFGSGLQGGLAQVQDQSNYNALGIDQNLEIGQNIFGIDNKISGLKGQLSNSQSNQATDSSIATLGGQIMGAAGPASRFVTGFGSSSGTNNYNSGNAIY